MVTLAALAGTYPAPARAVDLAAAVATVDLAPPNTYAAKINLLHKSTYLGRPFGRLYCCISRNCFQVMTSIPSFWISSITSTSLKTRRSPSRREALFVTAPSSASS